MLCSRMNAIGKSINYFKTWGMWLSLFFFLSFWDFHFNSKHYEKKNTTILIRVLSCCLIVTNLYQKDCVFKAKTRTTTTTLMNSLDCFVLQITVEFPTTKTQSSVSLPDEHEKNNLKSPSFEHVHLYNPKKTRKKRLFTPILFMFFIWVIIKSSKYSNLLRIIHI